MSVELCHGMNPQNGHICDVWVVKENILHLQHISAQSPSNTRHRRRGKDTGGANNFRMRKINQDRFVKNI